MSWNEPGLLIRTSLIVDLFVRSWVEMILTMIKSQKASSTSSWGRELKFVRDWELRFLEGRPLREVVSWNKYSGETYQEWERRPLREVVSWNRTVIFIPWWGFCRPLREVVSWNDKKWRKKNDRGVDLFVRSWVEMNQFPSRIKNRYVDLFVRSWVEMHLCWTHHEPWTVDLFVRSWVEILQLIVKA